MLRLWFSLYWLLLVLYSVFSYSLTDPNLVLTSWQPYWSFQQWMWQTFFANPPLLTYTYLGLVIALFGVFLQCLRVLHRSTLEYQFSTTKLLVFFVVLISPLLLSYNALSHDVFNYIFNAKLLTVYEMNPHVATALEVSGDDWTRFMHNTHTPAPYGYGWTGLSLLPFWAGMQKFTLTWLLFRVWSVVSVVLLFFGLQHLSYSLQQRRLRTEELAIVFLNPLFLLEAISNMHNDLWMIAPAIFAVSFFWRMKGLAWGKTAWFGLAGAVLLALSISIKLATLVLLPVVVLILWEKLLLNWTVRWLERKFAFVQMFSSQAVAWIESWYASYVPLVASILLFVPLLTARSQYFHPWYLLWSLVWLPLIQNRFWKALLLVFSLSSLVRYTPWLLEGGFADKTLFWQQLITWSIPAVGLLLWFARAKRVREVVRTRVIELIG